MKDETVLLKTTIEIYQNDFLCGYEGDDYESKKEVFSNFIIELTRLVNDFRYCSKKECSCSPESKLRSLWERERKFFIKMFRPYALTEYNPLKVVNFIERVICE